MVDGWVYKVRDFDSGDRGLHSVLPTVSVGLF